MTWILLKSPRKSTQFTKHFSSMHTKGNIQLKFENGGLLLDQRYIFYFLGNKFIKISQ